jgi:endogenous inhibitor of DNA gyrase (YacG/DUF329 family)
MDDNETKEQPKEQAMAGQDAEDIEPYTDDTTAESATCPECGKPVENVRVTCPYCGHRYEESEYEDTEAGNEFIAGSNVDDEGNEILTEEPASKEEQEAAGAKR